MGQKKIQRKITKYLEANKHENTALNIWDASKPSLRGKLCKRSRPGRFTQDLGGGKNILSAIRMSDLILFWGGVIHLRHKLRVLSKEVPTPLYTKCTQSPQGANTDLLII